MNTTVIYCRKSRGTQEELQNQIDLCLSYCSKNNYEVSEEFAEIRSSQDFEREQYKKLKKYIKENTNVRIVVTHADRLNRNVVQQAKLNELLLRTSSYIEVVGSGVIKLDTPEQQMLSNIINSFSEYQYKLIRYKMVTGLKQARKKGIRIGAKLFGYNIVNKRLVIDPTKADVVKRVFKLIADGYSTKQVVEVLRTEGITTNTGRLFDTRAVRLMIQNEGYTGSKGDNVYPPIIDRELYMEANKQLRSVPNCGGKKSYALSGKILCSKCGTSLIIGYKNDRKCAVINSCNSSNSIRGNSSKCSCMGSRLDIVENLVVSDSLAYLEIKLAELYHQLKEDKALLATHHAELQATQAEIVANRDKLSKLNTLFIMDNISQEELTEQSSVIKDRINLLELKQQRLEGYSLFKIAEELQERIIKLEEMQSSADIKDLVQLVDYVSYYKDGTGIQINTIFKE